VVDCVVGTKLERALEAFMPRWLKDTWGFQAVDLSP